ncbi:unnamed protein product [Owenia fusiformis]|uniref:Uncharacterized protein n=1 Tax=Owenia fusiformis TaxID=6347 RepID=A0A8S4NI25_OWEFU|nr:unnamed protein product [Owenia fusiformis]
MATQNHQCHEQSADRRLLKGSKGKYCNTLYIENNNDTFEDIPIIAEGRLTGCRLGVFLKQDIENPVILPLYPSSPLNTNYPLKNFKKYQTLEFPMYSLDTAAVKVMKTLATVGSGVPVMAFEIPRNLDFLKVHWRRWMPYYEECTDIRILNDDNLASIDDGSLFTLLPSEQLPVEKLAIDPDMLYEIYSKFFIPKIKIKQPNVISKESVRAPCVIKVPISQGQRGVKIATTDREIFEYEEWTKKQGWKEELMYQELLTDTIADRSVQTYIHKDGSVNIGGFSSQTFASNTDVWNGGTYSKTPEDEAENFRMINFLQPVLKSSMRWVTLVTFVLTSWKHVTESYSWSI